MSPLLKNLLGNGSKDRELAEDMRQALSEMRQERERFEALIESSRTAVDRLAELGDPIAKASVDVNAATTRLRDMEERLEAIATIANQVQSLDDRSAELSQNAKQTEAYMNSVLEDSGRIRAIF